MKSRLSLLSLLALGVVGAVIFKMTIAQPQATPKNLAAASSDSHQAGGSSSAVASSPAASRSPAARPVLAGGQQLAAQPSAGGQPGVATVALVGATGATPAQMAAVSQLPIRVHGEKVLAQMNVGGQSIDLEPNQVGAFPRVLIDLGQKVSVTVNWPDAQAGQRVVAAVEDGGTLNQGQRVLPLNLDGRLQVAFDFTAEQGPGIYRVTLRHGADTKALELWAGPELALKSE